jgi:hypothetical protein
MEVVRVSMCPSYDAMTPHRDALRRRLARIVREASEIGVALIYFSLWYRALVSVFMG